jgi:hypothetical protein
MSRVTSDRIKEELSWLRTVFPLLVAIDVALIAFMFQPTTAAQRVALAGVALAGTFALTVAVVQTVYHRLRQLEK